MINLHNIKIVKMIMETHKVWQYKFYGWLILFMMIVPLSAQNDPDVTMELYPNDNPQMISRLGWDQNLFSVWVKNDEDEPIQYRITFTLKISNSSITPGTIMNGRTRVGTKQWDEVNGHGYLGPNEWEHVFNNH
jgi:hypothetical protein